MADTSYLAVMRTFRVRRTGNGQWQGQEDGVEEILVSADDESSVRKIVFDRARETGPARVLVFDTSGAVLEERTFSAPKPKGYAGDWT